MKITGWNRTLMLASLIALICGAAPGQLMAGWVLPWYGNVLQDQVKQARDAEKASDRRAADAKKKDALWCFLSVALGLALAGTIHYHRNNRQVIQNVVREEKIVRTPAQDLVTDKLVIDGLNVIYGAPSDQKPALANLLGLLMELKNRNFSFKCFFDASTFYTLEEAGKTDDADAYQNLCRSFPDLFIEVPGGNQADDFILDYAHSHGTPIISNDRYRDYEEKYVWLKSESNRRVSFLVHSGMIQIVPLGVQASIPSNSATAMSSLYASFGKPLPVKAAAKSKRTVNHAPINGVPVLARV